MTRVPGDAPRRDEGSVLPLVLVLLVVSSLIVLPLLTYAVTVLKANSVVSERTKQLEAAKGGLRAVLADPAEIFLACDGSGTLPTIALNGLTVTTECVEIEEIGPLEALGYEVPVGATAMQLGATVPTEFVGTRRQSDPTPPYPATPDWWASEVSNVATSDLIWLPDLPVFPATVRSSTPFDMPAGFDCRVFFPGHYADAIDISSGRVYFASGVYYFESSVTVRGDADVVVGYGLEEFGTDCADDIQVAANVLGDPGTFAIDGGGATFVFGAEGHLVVDDTGGGSPSIRFNQRYAEIDRGGRVNIMSVDGAADADTDHVVDDVNHVPRGTLVDATTEPPTQLPLPAGTYAPSAITYTDAARAPLAPEQLTVDWFQVAPGLLSPRGAVKIEWNVPHGQQLGGARIDPMSPFSVTAARSVGPPLTFECTNADIVILGDRASCVVGELATGLSTDDYTIEVAVRNQVAIGTPATGGGRAQSVPELRQTGPATSVTAESTDVAGAARVSWTPPVVEADQPPVTGYEVTAYRVVVEPAIVPNPPTIALIPAGVCSTSTAPLVEVPTSCEIAGLDPLERGNGVDPGDLGYAFDVVGVTALGPTDPARSTDLPAAPPYPLDLPVSFDGDGSAAPVPIDPATMPVVPWVPEPIVQVLASGSGTARVAIAGHVSVPMGRLQVDNPNGDDIRMIGGVVAGTFDVVDSRGSTGEAGSVPIGFLNEIVLQRTVRIVSRAGNAVSNAVVQVNEDGARFAVNSWSIG